MKISLIVTAYNRPEYLKQCLASISAANLSQLTTLLIVDDCSDNQETRKLIDEFELADVELIKAFSKENRSIKGSLLYACNLLYPTTDIFINLDSDAIIRQDFFTRLIELKKEFPDNLVSGFNCRTLNKNGTVRHHVLSEAGHFNTKKTVGGINIVFNQVQYLEWIKPALEKCLKNGGNWDETACLIAYNGYGKDVVCAVPSVCQHIGFDSSMGHSAGGEPPDIAEDFQTEINQQFFDNAFNRRDRNNPIYKTDIDIFLSSVTLVGADCVKIERLVDAANKCQEKILFGGVILFTSLPTYGEDRIKFISPIKNKEEYSWFIMKEMPRYIKTSHMLIIQHDGYVLNPDAWDDGWLQYDYIGAPWNWYSENQVGNGGFSLRSKRLMDIVASDEKLIPVSDGLNTHKEEDHCICRIYRKYLEDKYDIKFAPVEVARKFSIEGWRSENKTWTNEFGFHGNGLTNVKP